MCDLKTVKLLSSDNELFEAPREILELSTILSRVLEFHHTDEPLPLDVDGRTLARVLEFCKHYIPPPNNARVDTNTLEMETRDYDFCASLNQAEIFEVILASTNLGIKPLLDVTCKTVASMIKGKSPEDIRKTFNIKNDFTPEEEDEVRKENEWCEER